MMPYAMNIKPRNKGGLGARNLRGATLVYFFRCCFPPSFVFIGGGGGGATK